MPTALARILGMRFTDADLIDATRKGLPSKSISFLSEAGGLNADQVAAALGVSARTLARKKSRRLSSAESDRAIRLARIFAMALDLYEGDKAAVAAWLHEPILALGGKAPIDFLDTDVGLRRLEQVLTNLDYGGIG